MQGAGKVANPIHDWFWFCTGLAEKLTCLSWLVKPVSTSILNQSQSLASAKPKQTNDCFWQSTESCSAYKLKYLLWLTYWSLQFRWSINTAVTIKRTFFKGEFFPLESVRHNFSWKEKQIPVCNTWICLRKKHAQIKNADWKNYSAVYKILYVPLQSISSSCDCSFLEWFCHEPIYENTNYEGLEVHLLQIKHFSCRLVLHTFHLSVIPLSTKLICLIRSLKQRQIIKCSLY